MKSLKEGKLLSVQVGEVKQLEMPVGMRVDFRDAHWSSGIYKTAIKGAVRVTAAGIAGDAQADLENHGGPDNVVLAYDAAHYPVWRERLGMPELAYGYFGENFTVNGFSDDDVCIADIWQVGEGENSVLLQVTQARQPCYKLARRLSQPDIVKMVKESKWGGWYLRVLRDGMVAAGTGISLIERKYPEWTAARAVEVMYMRRVDGARAKELRALPELSARWRRELLDAGK